ncbi:MAG: DedA family protein [Actinomycetota bacterium]|nr:DedA family protein [Actinomycetota bacterium]
MSDSLTGLAGWVSDVIQSLGYVGIAVLVALENLLPPIPSEVILPLAGFLVGQGRFEFLPVLVASTAGSLVGALALYGLGWWLGEERLRRFVGRFGRFLWLEEADLDRATGWFKRYGGSAVFFGRLVPGVRSLISVPAGVERMPTWRFVAYTLGGSALWNALLVGAGWILGDRWAQVEQYTQALQYVLLAAAIVAVAWFLWRRLGRSR